MGLLGFHFSIQINFSSKVQGHFRDDHFCISVFVDQQYFVFSFEGTQKVSSIVGIESFDGGIKPNFSWLEGR
jgi:hypothetical protein